MPLFYFKKKYVIFILTGILLLASTVLLLHSEIFPWSNWSELRLNAAFEIVERRGKASSPGSRLKGRLTPLFIAFLGNTLMNIARFANQKEKEKLAAELKFLKSQINPHFLFNALNNIYSLAVVQAAHTPESVMQLSEILRYMVYDSNQKKVALKSELDCIKNFIDLNLLKDSRGMNVEINLDEVDPNISIAPLLFVPFVENAFKHSGIENREKGFIKIALKADNKKIEFRVLNSVPDAIVTKDEVGGVGLENIKKRLEIIYPGKRHQLNINKTNTQFEIVLEIFLP